VLPLVPFKRAVLAHNVSFRARARGVQSRSGILNARRWWSGYAGAPPVARREGRGRATRSERHPSRGREPQGRQPSWPSSSAPGRVVARRLSTFLSPWKRLIYSSRTPGATVACSSISHCACTLMAWWWPWWRRSSRVSSDITFFLLRSGQMTLLPFTPCMNVLNYFTDACRRFPPVVRPEAVPVDGLVVQAHLRALVPAGGNVGICHRSAARPPCGQAGDDVPRQG